MLKRILSTLIFIPIFIFCLQKEFFFTLMISVIAGICLIEFNKMSKNKSLFSVLSTILGISFVFCFYLVKIDIVPLFLFLSLFLFFILHLNQKSDEINIDSLWKSLLGIIYISMLLGFIIKIRMFPDGIKYILILFIGTWGFDVGAYFSGVYLGKHKFFSNISPKKTIEGVVGGIVLNMLLLLFMRFFYSDIFLNNCILLCLILSISGLMGDISESIIKRNFKVKDSGNIIPGHGGMLDVIDSLLFAAPCLYYYLKFF
ncbi:MAG: CDP-archaeol synthase [bacterium]